MASKKNNYKHKMISTSKDIKNSTNSNKMQKLSNMVDEIVDDKNLVHTDAVSANISTVYKQKILDMVNVNWLNSKNDKNFQKILSEVTSGLESEHTIIKSNLKELEEASTHSINEIKQATSALQTIVTTVTEIEHIFKSECVAEETKLQSQIEQLKEDYDQEIQKLKETLVSSAKKHELEVIKNSFIRAMQTNHNIAI